MGNKQILINTLTTTYKSFSMCFTRYICIFHKKKQSNRVFMTEWEVSEDANYNETNYPYN